MERTGPNREDEGQSYLLESYPLELKKKVILLEHFNSYLDGVNLDYPMDELESDLQTPPHNLLTDDNGESEV